MTNGIVKPAAAFKPKTGLGALTREILARFGILPVFIIVLGAIAGITPSLLNGDNIAQVLRQSSIAGVMALGATFVLISGRIDLSIGSLLSLASFVTIDVHERAGAGAALLAALGIGGAVGLVNGFIVGYLRLNPLIATLAMMSLLQGVTLVYSGGADIYVAHPDTTWFAVFGRGFLFGLPVPVLLFAALAVALGILLHMTAFGRKIFAIGGNETAAAFSGIDTRKTVALAYLIGGLTTSVAALIIASRVMGAQANTGAGYEFDVISAVILGGTSFLGGSGTMAGTVVGVVLLAFMQNGLLLLGLPYYLQWIITWGVIISAVWAEMAAKRKRILL
ncbi:ABC transporter permease [Sodalis sp. RH16]|uniref:ABC transporter permease n=1 Tax=Sodalis sp. RH16 TaxID=3394331 RepID=UPI0039B46831